MKSAKICTRKSYAQISSKVQIHNWGEPERAPHRRVECSQSIYVYIYYWGEPERAPHRRVERSQSIYIYIMVVVVRPSPARRHIHCTATRDIFRWPHEETSALSGTTCIIIAESAKQIALASEPVSRKAKWLQILIAILVMLPLYLECLAIC